MAIQECYYFNGVGPQIFCSGSSNKFFVVTYTFLFLVLTIDFCYSQLIIFCILFNPHMHKLGPRGPTYYIFGD